MPLPKLRLNRKSFWLPATITTLLLWFIVSFRAELVQVIQLIINTLKLSLGFEVAAASPQAAHALAVIVYNILFSFGITGLVWLFLIASQTLLPLNNLQERYRSAWHLILHILGKHGPAIFIKNGEEIASALDKKKNGQGVVVIDFNSAIVLEQLVPPPSLSRPFHILGERLLEILGLSDPHDTSLSPTGSSQRVCGPGVVFTRSNERIRGTLDLRNQSRFTSNINAYTSDGIELKTAIWTLFSVGQQADLIEVIYQGERHPENLRAVSVKYLSDGYVRLTVLPHYELDEVDREAIYKATSRGIVRSDFYPASPVPDLPQFDSQRVFAAVSSKAYNNPGGQIEWDQLPLQVSVDLFRELLLQINYDRLYNPDEAGVYLIPELKSRFHSAVRNMGVLSYRMLFPRNGNISGDLKDGIYHTSDLLVSPTLALPNFESKLLRERGIKVIAAGFLDLIPISEAIYQQRLDNWRAYWEKDATIARAKFDLEVTRTRQKAYSIARKELEQEFSKIVRHSAANITQEALTMRIFQALDSIAADPKTRQMLPSESLNLLRSLHSWLLPGDNLPPNFSAQPTNDDKP